MKKTLLIALLAAVTPSVWAQQQTTESRTDATTTTAPDGSTATTTQTTTTEGDGTITEFTPGDTIVLKESQGDRHYRFDKRVVYVTKDGKTLSEDEVRERVKVGIPVHVHYTGTGDNMVVDRVIVGG